jgi:hypothetical protein
VTPPVRVGPAPVDSQPGPGARAGRGIPPAAGPGFRRSHRDGHRDGRWRTDSESRTVPVSLSLSPAGLPGRRAESKSGDRAVASDRGSDDPGDCPITGPAALCQLSDDSRSSLSQSQVVQDSGLMSTFIMMSQGMWLSSGFLGCASCWSHGGDCHG